MARRWVSDHAAELAAADPPPLDALDERQQEVWDPLFAVGLVAGGEWYERLKTTALAVSGGREPGSVGLTLLTDIAAVFGTADWMTSANLAQLLNAIEGRPWADWSRGKGLTPNALARQLKPFGIVPTLVGEKRLAGYRRDAFQTPWAVYVHVEPLNLSDSSNDANNSPSGNLSPEEAREVVDSPGNPHGDSFLRGREVANTGGPGLEADIPLFDPEQDARDALQGGA